jgi:hypothetical protein
MLNLPLAARINAAKALVLSEIRDGVRSGGGGGGPGRLGFCSRASYSDLDRRVSET